ncbi:MAG TPA: hypothetical protein VH370_07945 [Humisphaera sp.]|nr:hypothetical protein [Humisphaera sp.]
MKRLRRILGNTTAMVSLVLCLACVGAWVRSDFACDAFGYGFRTSGGVRTVSVSFNDGMVQLRWFKWSDVIPVSTGFAHDVFEAEPGYPRTLAWRDDDWRPIVSGQVGRRWGKIGRAPLWPAVAAFALWPAIWTLLKRKEIRRRRRIKSGQCQSCGYDLRATPERCPECGATPEART